MGDGLECSPMAQPLSPSCGRSRKLLEPQLGPTTRYLKRYPESDAGLRNKVIKRGRSGCVHRKPLARLSKNLLLMFAVLNGLWLAACRRLYDGRPHRQVNSRSYQKAVELVVVDVDMCPCELRAKRSGRPV